MNAARHDDRICKLGEGPLWHPARKQLFWFDILGCRLLSQQGGAPVEWQFEENVSAAGWLDHDTLLIASETALFRFDLTQGTREVVFPLEADLPATRSNDGRADPWGGFWIGTMGKHAEPGAGSIYRFYGGELRRIAGEISVSNAICFAPDSSAAYYTDTHSRQVMRVPLEPQTGWPAGSAQVLIDLTADGLNPDGAVTDADGNIWIAQWGAARVAQYSPQGTFLSALAVPALQASCPAFGGAGLRDLYVTSASVGLDAAEKTARPHNGKTFVIANAGQGLPEPKVIL
ncbi:SMP-30/gluconolactonase/LRE family protein [Aliishimia ponticola]|uniref:SMP-30/gluconolactonase/LRE family protein n=1 Tax=Aliishimia ponticola TaxID=2499833 RepID=A0A4S4ND44_9RHOB|nr:SMP-30/gluconolactonase/LRE family protein [Aliishimia ponticola]THH35951.1 SMP-30/gluconolactonase/LRE family protein [Aliishimia ponticola]